MTRPLLPPRGIFIATAILFAQTISPPERDTLIQLMALAWGSATCQTPPLSLAMLENLTGKKARTLRGHLAALRSQLDSLRIHPAGKGKFIILFADWMFGVSPASSEAAGGENLAPGGGNPLPGGQKVEKMGYSDGKILPSAGVLKYDHKEKEDDEIHTGMEVLPPPDGTDPVKDAPSRQDSGGEARDFREKTGAKTAAASAVEPSTGAALPARLQSQMEDAGVFRGLFPEIEKIAREQKWSVKDIQALLAWCIEDAPERPGGLFVARIRRGFRPPKRYYRPPCKYCGMRGQHASDCRGRYALDSTYR